MTRTNIDKAPATDDNQAPRLAYCGPEAIEVGNAADMIQGGGGRSGMDYLYYYYLDGNYE